MLHLSSTVAEERLVWDAGWDFMGMGKDRMSLAGAKLKIPLSFHDFNSSGS